MIPQFCPNPACAHHHDDSTPSSFAPFCVSAGAYYTKVVGWVPRFRCTACGRNFSERTFALDYYTKKSLDYAEVFRSIAASESVSAIARHLGCSGASVQNRLERLGRNALAAHARLVDGLSASEDLVADGFESFDRSQYFPNNFNLLLGKDSQFLYRFTHASLRRKGRLTESQRRQRETYDRLWVRPPNALRRACDRLFAAIPDLNRPSRQTPLRLWTDEHQTYVHALAANEAISAAQTSGRFIHTTISSTAPRTVFNPLFSANYYDRELRKDIAAFHRESTCFTRNVAAGYFRFVTYALWHNYCKPHRVGYTPEPLPVHAVVAGVDPELIREELQRLFMDRAFLSRAELSAEEIDIWLKQHRTPLKTRAEYVPKFAMERKCRVR